MFGSREKDGSMRNNITKSNSVYKSIFGWLMRHLLLVCFVFVMLVWSVRLVSLHYSGWYSTGSEYDYLSDQIAQQDILLWWQEGYHEHALVGDDSFIIKYPLYVIANNLPVSPIKQLFLTNAVILFLTALLILWSLNRIYQVVIRDKIKQRSALVVSSIMLAGVPVIAFFLLAFPNSRNVELGLFMVLVQALVRWLYDKNYFKTRRNLKIGGLGFLFASLMASDPMFLYNVAMPAIIVASIWALFVKRDTKWLMQLVAFSGLSVILSVIFQKIFTSILPLELLDRNIAFASFQDFVLNLKDLFAISINVFGIDFWTKSPFSPSAIMSAGYLLVFLFAIAGFVLAALRDKKKFVPLFLLTLVVWIMTLSVVGNTSAGGTDKLIGRYLLLIIPIQLVGVGLLMNYVYLRRQLVVVVLLVSTVLTLSFAQTLEAYKDYRHVAPNDYDFAAIEIIKKEGLDKGYSFYTNSRIRTFLSGHDVNIVTVQCEKTQKELVFYPYLSEKAALNKPSASGKTFYLFVGKDLGLVDCTPDQLAHKLGQPEKIIKLPRDEYMAVYDYDIGEKINR